MKAVLVSSTVFPDASVTMMVSWNSDYAWRVFQSEPKISPQLEHQSRVLRLQKMKNRPVLFVPEFAELVLELRLLFRRPDSLFRVYPPDIAQEERLLGIVPESPWAEPAFKPSLPSHWTHFQLPFAHHKVVHH